MRHFIPAGLLPATPLRAPVAGTPSPARGRAVPDRNGLVDAGAESKGPASRRAQAFLANTHDSDGSWAMESRECGPAKDVGAITHAGTACDVMGLVRSTPKGRGPAK